MTNISGILLHLIQACLRVTDNSKTMTEVRDGIRLEDILWESLKTLETVSSHGDIRLQLTNPSTAHLLMKSVNSNNENLVQVGLSVIAHFESYDNFMLLIKNDPRFELISKLCHYLNPKIAQLAVALLGRLNQLPGEKTDMFGVQWGESVPTPQQMRGDNPQHLSDVVDLDATTAQYRNDSFIKSPSGNVVAPGTPSSGGGALHNQYSPRYPSPHMHQQQHQQQQQQQQQSPYNSTPSATSIPFPTTYSTSLTPMQYQGMGCHPNFQPGYPPPPTQHTRAWYAAM